MDQIGRLEEIVYFPAKGEAGILTEEQKVSVEAGLEGDYHGDNSLTVWTKEARDTLTEQEFAGICFRRFKENLSLSGLDLSRLKPGTKLYIGDVILEVEARRKECHPDVCPLREGRADCLLKKQSLFVKVKKSGTLFKGAKVTVDSNPKKETIFDCNVRLLVKKKEADSNQYFGRGVADLLHGIETYHSLRVSAMQMQMAYSKAWRIIRHAEEGLGISLISRMGKRGSKLTEEGELFLKVYEEIEKETRKVAHRIFRKYYKEDEE